ncbi:ABC-2 type transport system ATP-binding protein/lipopolysaccharide transport system ATP-binding protein [Geobacter sp. DSM 9736]|nr:ABC-2 type transport system ATP-binding protein/lipopolysaccharide transport system ATP-binding protein [Geobacter sp. DSM 9736]
MLSEPVIQFRNVWKKYSKRPVMNNSIREEIINLFTRRRNHNAELDDGEFWALRDVSLDVRRGQCLGLYGPNGSGKSTSLKLISNVTYPTRGSINVDGRVAPLIELGAGMHPDLTGIENIYMNGSILGLSVRETKRKLGEIMEFSELQDFVNVPVKKYSSGMYLRLAFSIAVHSPADIFLFDEVLAVGDERFQARCLERLMKIRQSGKSMIIVSHNIEQLNSICNTLIQVDSGVMSSFAIEG